MRILTNAVWRSWKKQGCCSLLMLLFTIPFAGAQQSQPGFTAGSNLPENDLPFYLCAGASNFYFEQYLNTFCKCPVEINATQSIDTVIIDFVVDPKGNVKQTFIVKGDTTNTCVRSIESELKKHWWHAPDLQPTSQKVQCRRTFYINHWQGTIIYTATLPEDPAYREQNYSDTKVLDVFDVSKTPSFPGGEWHLYQWLAGFGVRITNIKTQSDYVVVSFVVNRVGSISELQIIKDGSSNGKYGQRALTILQKMPQWFPGEANGWPVSIRMTLGLYFEFLPEEAVSDTLETSLLTDCLAVPVSWNEARFPGGYGLDSLFRFIARNKTYTPLLDKNSIRHTVFVKFTVEADGKLTCITATMSKASSEAGYGREALRIMSLMPDWLPAQEISNGTSRPIRSQNILTISFP